jgi:hypothetical protein
MTQPLKLELKRIGDFFKKAANVAVEGDANLITLLRDPSNQEYIFELTSTLVEKDQLSEQEYLDLTSAFFAFYVYLRAARRKG